MLFSVPPESVWLGAYKWDDNLAIGVGLEVVVGLQVLANDSVVVDLAVDSKGNALISVGQWLGTRLYVWLVSVRCYFGRAHFLPTPTMERRSWARTETG